ncbi:hypothetical protein LR003_02310 [candidate division NPL-UPA2 bacterium]|nr:hypothetical protein [candidate division NPL-UPA2 bacterium]
MIAKGGIPALKVERKTLPEAWEKAVLITGEEGIAMRTEYDRKGGYPSLQHPFCCISRRKKAVLKGGM